MGYASLGAYAARSSAVSDEAQQVSTAAADVLRQREASQALFGAKAAAISRLNEAAAEAASLSDPDQLAPTARAMAYARRFLTALPEDVRVPDIGIDPDGAISLDWIVSRTRIFSVSIGATERIAYAWRDGSDRGHAVARFGGVHLPPQLLASLRAMVSDERTRLRAA